MADMPVEVAATQLLDLPAQEEAQIKARLLSRDLVLNATLHAFWAPEPVLVISATVPIFDKIVRQASIEDVTFWRQNPQTTEWESAPAQVYTNGYYFGSYSFSVDGAELTNVVVTVEPVRVDGHQDQMIKTEWKPRNLLYIDAVK